MIYKLVKLFTNDEPLKSVDYPRGAYSAYWEIVDSEVPGGFRSEVRIMGYENTLLRDKEAFIAPTKDSVDKQVQDFLKTAMSQYKRA